MTTPQDNKFNETLQRMVNSLVSGDSFPEEQLTREFVAKVIHNRGRRVLLMDYLEAYPDELLKGLLVAGSIGSGKTERGKSIVMAALDSIVVGGMS